MSIEEFFGNYFKAEVKTSGAKLLSQEKISIASGSDTAIQAYVRATPPVKVKLSASGIASRAFVAECTCPAAKKSQFCKHVWAALLGTEERYPDFLSEKRSIEKASAVLDPEDVPELTPRNQARAESQAAYKESARVRANTYRKEQYQKQKTRAKELKNGRQGGGGLSKVRSSYPPEVEAALAYFIGNGFEMPDGPSEVILSEAKKKLSRVFHPDRGGATEEVVELNQHCDALMGYLRG